MRNLAAVVAAGVVLVLAAGCAQQGTAGGGGPTLSTPPAPASTSPDTVAPVPGTGIPGVAVPPGKVAVPAAKVDAKALPYDFPRLVWTENGSRALGFYGEVGGCLTSRATVDRQTAKTVTVRLIEQVPGTGEHACPMFVRYKAMSVTLAQPLGDRTVQLLLSNIRG